MHRRLALALLLSLAAAGAVAADGWSRYENPRYGYAVDIPPGFSRISEAENGDGGTSRAAGGRATLAVWGTGLLVDSFKGEAGGRVESAKLDGWEISLNKISSKSATWSGTREDRILYVHGRPGCEGEAAYFQLEYDADVKEAFDPLIARMAKSFQAKSDCN